MCLTSAVGAVPAEKKKAPLVERGLETLILAR